MNEGNCTRSYVQRWLKDFTQKDQQGKSNLPGYRLLQLGHCGQVEAELCSLSPTQMWDKTIKENSDELNIIKRCITVTENFQMQRIPLPCNQNWTLLATNVAHLSAGKESKQRWLTQDYRMNVTSRYTIEKALTWAFAFTTNLSVISAFTLAFSLPSVITLPISNNCVFFFFVIFISSWWP